MGLNSAEAYESMVVKATEICSVFLDMCGGFWALATFCELLQELIEAKNWSASRAVIKKLYHIAEVNGYVDNMDEEVIHLFLNIMLDCVSGQ